MNEMTLAPIARRRRGSGTLRERRPGVFEIRIPVGIDPVTHRTRQASHSVRGTRAEAEAMLDRLVAQASQDSSVPGPLLGGPLPQRRPDRPMPRPAADASRRTGRDAALAAGRVLRRGGGRPFPHPARSAGLGVLRADHRPTPAAIHARTRPRHATTPTARGRRPHPAGHRRGELAALRLDDLRGRVLHISRADSAGHLTTPKSGHGRTLTLGAGTARLWHTLVAEWEGRAKQPIGPWVFSADPDHRRRLDVATLGHRFTRLRETAGIPDATLHRLRHSVATFLVARGEILQAQARLGQRPDHTETTQPQE